MINILNKNTNDYIKKENIIKGIVFLIIFLILFELSKSSAKIVCSLFEIFSIVISYCVVIIAINCSAYYKNSFFTFLALSYSFISTLNLISILIIGDNNICMKYKCFIGQVLIIGRYMEIISFAVAFKFINKNINIKKLLKIYVSILLGIVINMIIFKDFFLNNIINKQCIIIFKKSTPIILVIIMIHIMVILRRKKSEFKLDIYRLLMAFLSCNILAYVMFFSYGPRSFIVQFFRFLAFCTIYIAMIKNNLKDPFKLIFKELKNKAEELERVNLVLDIKNKDLEKAKNNIENTNKKYEKFLEFLPDPVLIHKSEKVVYVNKAFLDLFKFNDKSEVIGKNVFNYVSNKYKSIVRQRIEEEKALKKVPFIEEELLDKHGNILEVEVSAFPVKLEDNIYNLVIVRDLIERNEIRKLKFDLIELEEREDIRSKFFANISHEIKTPINVIYSALQLEDIYIENKDIGNMKKYNDFIKKNCYRLIRLSDNLIDVTKIDSGVMTVEMRYYNIVQLIENIISSVAIYIKNKNLSIIFDTDTEEKYILCDINLMERIILNLLSNAIKFSKVDGDIFVNIQVGEEKLLISIKDDGIGIPKSKLERVFGRFVQADTSFTRRCEGSGIGLSIVKSFVELQGGKICCNSEEGKGTEFIIDMPLGKQFNENWIAMEHYYSENSKITEKIKIEFSDIYSN